MVSKDAESPSYFFIVVPSAGEVNQVKWSDSSGVILVLTILRGEGGGAARTPLASWLFIKIELHWGQNPLICWLLLLLYHSCFKVALDCHRYGW